MVRSGIGAARLKQPEKAKESAAQLEKLRDKLTATHEDYWAGQVEIQRVEVAAWTDLAEGERTDALKTLNHAVELEEATDKSAVTPGPLAPARELLGDMLMQLGNAKQALQQYESTLTKEPNRFRALYGAARAAKLAGDYAKSKKYFAQLAKVCERGDKPGRKELVEARGQ